MKISILGYSGSGKSTLAKKLGEKYNLDVLHLDTVQFLPNWVIRPEDEKQEIVLDFMDSHAEWIIEGNYSRLHQERRLAESDKIILVQLNRFSSLFRVIKRYLTFRGKTRSDMADGCEEKLDFEFVKWVLFESRTKERRERFLKILIENKQKTVVLKSQKRINNFIESL